VFRGKITWRRPLLSVTQLVVLVVVLAGLFVVLDLNRRAQAGRLVGVGEDELEQQLAAEQTRQVELQATLEYVQSEAYVAAYARGEGGMLLPGERRVVPLAIEATGTPPSPGQPTPDPALNARPWQAWWQLLTDAPLPARD
jgi:cell division protein FtsB